MISCPKITSLLSVSLTLLMLTSCGKSQQQVEQQPKTEPTAQSPTEEQSETKEPSVGQKGTSASSKSDKPLEPGDYCFEVASETLDAQMKLNLEANQQVTGEISATIHNDAQGYYTSYNQEFNGLLEEEKLPVDITTQIEGDTQTIQETWTVNSDSLSTGRETYQTIPCSKLGD